LFEHSGPEHISWKISPSFIDDENRFLQRAAAIGIDFICEEHVKHVEASGSVSTRAER
jgi:hypothetical protein